MAPEPDSPPHLPAGFLPWTPADGPLFTVVTATYESEATVAATLASVAAQEERDLEHLVIDGASRDRTLEIVGAADGVRVRSEPDRGIYDAFNKGLAEARGELITFLNSDDCYANPRVLTVVAEAARRWPEVDVFHADLDLVDAQDRVVEEVRFFPEHPVDGPRNRDNYAGLRYRPHIAHQTAFVRRRVFAQVGGFDPEFRLAGDHEHFLRAYLSGCTFRYLPHVLVRMRNDGVSQRRAGLLDREVFAISRRYAEDWREPAKQFARHQVVLALHRRAPRLLDAVRAVSGSPRHLPWGPLLRRHASADRPLRLNLLLPSLHDTGGVRITVELAARLRGRGHDAVLFVPRVYPDHGQGLLRQVKTSLLNAVRWSRWSQDVPTLQAWTLERGLRDADVTVASAWTTAEALAQLPESCGAKVYHVQDHEVFAGPAARVDATYRQDALLVATSPYLVNLLRERFGREARLSPLALDTERFHPRWRTSTNAPLRVLFLHHAQPRKGTDRVQRALALARERGLQLTATAFGLDVPAQLEGADRTVRAPQGDDLVRLYSEHDVYLTLPRQEGWGLTVPEAMATGACVVCTRVGALDVVDPEGEAVVVVDDEASAAQALIDLAADPDRRAALGKRAVDAAARLSWDRAVDSFEVALREAAETR